MKRAIKTVERCEINLSEEDDPDATVSDYDPENRDIDTRKEEKEVGM